MSNTEIRELLLQSDIFGPAARNMGHYVGGLMMENDALLNWTADEVAAELAAMEAEGLATQKRMAGAWCSTHEGRVASERLMRRHAMRAACLCDPSQHAIDDIVLALVATTQVCELAHEHRAADEGRLAVHLFDRTKAEIDASLARLEASGQVQRYDFAGFRDAGRSIRLLVDGKRAYHTTIADRLGIPEGDCILDAQPAPVVVHDVLLQLGLDAALVSALAERMHEAELCERAGAPLAATVLYGSVLEGVLAGLADRDPRTANTMSSSPKDPQGAVKPFALWKFAEWIAVSLEAGWIPRSVSGHVTNLRDSRNLVHVQTQVRSGVVPDKFLARVTREVLAAVLDGIRERLAATP